MTDTETIINDLIREGRIDARHLDLNPEHWNPRQSSVSYHYCALCAETLPPGKRLENHLSAQKHHGINVNSAIGKALIQFSKGVMEKIKYSNLNMDEIPDPETNGEWSIHMAYLKQLRKFGIPIRGKEKKKVDDINIKHVLSTLAKKVIGRNTQKTVREETNFDYQSESSHDEGDMRPIHSGNSIPSNLVISSIDDQAYTGGSTVQKTFKKNPRTELMFQHHADHFNKDYYTVSYTPNESGPEWTHHAKKVLQLWRKVNTADHPILLQYEEHVKRNQLKDGKPNPSTAGTNAYPMYIARFAIVAMRARQRFGQQVTVDDIIYSCAFIQQFFDRMRLEKVSVSVRLNFMKSIRNFIKWLEQYLNPVWMTGDRGQMCTQLKNRLLYVLTELKVEDKKESSIANVARESTKKPVLYSVARAIVSHKSFQEEVDRIFKKVRDEGKDVSHAEYNFVLGVIFFFTTVYNTTRNEACYKSINATFLQSKDKFGKDIEGTGLKSFVEGGNTYWVATYPNPKQARGMRSRSSVLGGLFVINKTIYGLIQRYILLRRHVLEQMSTSSRAIRLKIEDKIDNPRSAFFLRYDGMPVDLYTVPWMMKTSLRVMNVQEDVSCNAVRHTTANMEYDEYVTRELSGGAHKDVAYLAGHDKVTQLRTYTDEYKKIALCGFLKLEELSNEEEQKNMDAVKEATKHIHLLKKLKTLDVAIASEENETDEQMQVIRDGEVSDYEEDREIERSAKSTDPADVAVDTMRSERIHPPKAKQRMTLRKSTVLSDVKYNQPRESKSSSSSSSSASSSDASVGDLRRKKSLVAADGAPVASEEGPPLQFEDASYTTMMNELNLEETPAQMEENDDVLHSLSMHNALKVSSTPKKSMEGDDLVDFKKRRYNRPVQDFPWIRVTQRPDGQFGLFAKCAIAAGSIVVDYRGRTLSCEAHEAHLQELQPVERDHVLNYYFEHKFDYKGKTVKFGIEAHHAVYDGSVVLGRFMNHSRCCYNVRPKFHKSIHGKSLEVFVYFVAKRDIEEGEEILWFYGENYEDTDWYNKCEVCKPESTSVRDFSKPKLSTEPRIETAYRGPSMSQSHVDAPFILPPDRQIYEGSSLMERIYISTMYPSVYLSGQVSSDATWLEAVNKARTIFGAEAIDRQDVIERSTDCLSLLTTFAARLDQLESSVLVLKRSHGFDDSVALIFGNYEIKTFIIYREYPRQFLVLAGEPNRRGDRPVEHLLGNVRAVRALTTDAIGMADLNMDCTSIFKHFRAKRTIP